MGWSGADFKDLVTLSSAFRLVEQAEESKNSPMGEPEQLMMDQRILADLAKIFDRVDALAGVIEDEHPPPIAGSTLAEDDVATDPFHISHAAIWGLVSAVDHVKALRTLVVDSHTVPARAPFTLLRAALENAATTVWLLAPSERAERVLRRLRLQWANIKDDESARQLIDHAQTVPTKDKKRRLQDIGRAAGLSSSEVSLIASRTVGFSSIVETAGREGNGLEADIMLLVWKLCSGIAHAKSWAVLGLLDRDQIKRVTENVAQVRLSAPDSALLNITGLAAAAIQEGWRLFAAAWQPTQPNKR
ncbi:hypothetical protein OG738_13575 [Amycolatopsis sp. NBC_01488]|uniref:hypothetical protein n=1 Tax=Amycolatopsis sp. NBC_01488 TaxID=2903563 RepID=UPI002E29AF97|nr:hypothetical protein [Amycolatopsis sp. NBC_01488]